MLTMNGPIKLNTRAPLLTVSEGFAERIRGNYGLMTARITPKDLLLLTVSQEPPPLAEGSVTNITVNGAGQQVSRVALEVINHVVNRILLSESPSFTYQDTVYVTSVLHRLGITDAREFMRQVHALREENVSVYRLLQTYRNNAALFSSVFEPETKAERSSGSGREEEERSAEGPRYTLHNEIYRRLATARIYQVMQAFQRGGDVSLGGEVKNSELALSEQLRVSNEISVWQAKERVVPESRIFLQNHVNRFETGEGMPPPHTEEQVLSQGAAAALLSIADSVLVSRMDTVLNRSDFWLNLRSAVTRSAENSLARFQSFRTGDTAFTRGGDVYSSRVSALYREETAVLNRVAQEIRNLAGGRYLTAVTQQASFADALRVEYRQALEQTGPAEPPETSLPSREEAASVREQLEKLTRSILTGGEAPAPSGVFSRGQGKAAPEQNTQAVSAAEREARLLFERCTHTLQGLTQSQTRLVVAQQEAAARAPEEPEEPREESAVPAEKQMLDSLDRINRHNRELHDQVVRQQADRLLQSVSRQPDRGKTQRDSLRALENPEAVLEEIFARSPAAEPVPPVDSALETVLAHTDETTRRIFEAVRRYESNPAQAVQSGMIRPSNAGEFNATVGEALERTVEEAEQTVRRHAVKEDETVRSLVETIAKQVQEAPPPEVPAQERSRSWESLPRVPIVHRKTGSGADEELRELLEHRKRTEYAKVNSPPPLKRETEVIEDAGRIGRQTAEKAAEDITEIVNRTLARQLGTISEKVYSRMEKKLQSERARRGWM